MAGHTYPFPYGFSLADPSSVRVRKGPGTNSATDLYWGRASSVCNNNHDTALLRDADGQIMDECAWRGSDMKAGEHLERLAMRLFQLLLQQGDASNLRVEHDAQVAGKTATHQVDVFWEFEVAKIRYLTLIQVKDWAKPVDQGEVLKFKAILDDVPGQPRGIMVSKMGFQSGARDLAQSHGILLFQLREGQKSDRTRTRFVWNLRTYLRRYENLRVVLDKPWLNMEGHRAGLVPGTHVRAVEGQPKDISILDGQGRQVMRLSDAIKAMFPREAGPMKKTRRRYELGNNAFVPTAPGMPIQRMKVLAFEADVGAQAVDTEVGLEFGSLPAWILQNLLEDPAHAFDESGRIIESSPVASATLPQWASQSNLP